MNSINLLKLFLHYYKAIFDNEESMIPSINDRKYQLSGEFSSLFLYNIKISTIFFLQP